MAKPSFTFTLTRPVVTIHTATLLTPRAFKDANGLEKGEPKFGATFLFNSSHADWRSLKIKAAEAALSLRPGMDVNAPGAVKWPWSLGDLKADEAKAAAARGEGHEKEYLRGWFVMKARSLFEITLALNTEDRGVVPLLTPAAKLAAKGNFYDGVLCGAEFNFKPYKRDDGGIGVTAYLNTVVSEGVGEPIQTGGKNVQNTFKGYKGRAQTDIDPGMNEPI